MAAVILVPFQKVLL